MGLAGWNVNNKLELTIDGSKIDGGMADFPVLITLFSGSGQTGHDTTCVFDELATASGSYDNRKKIAVTTTISGIETELYVEIERWDDTTASGNEQAWLWTKVPTLVSGTDTDLYLYYDSNHTTNSGHIGDTGETPAQNVWDSNFVGVWHMAQDPSGGSNCILDSTSNTNHGTPAGSMTSADLVDGKIGKAIDFDGNNDYLATGITSIGAGGPATWEMVMNLTQQASTKGTYIYTSPVMYIHNANNYVYFWDTNDYFNTAIDADDNYLAINYDGTTSTSKLYKNGGAPVSATQQAGNHDIDAWNGWIGDNSLSMYGNFSEHRMSSIVRTAAWIKATYYSNWDNLITFGTVVSFVFTNPIPTHLSTVYGDSHTLQLTTTISGEEPSYVYDAVFYDASNDSQIGSTVSGTNSGQAVSTTMQTPLGVDYTWYMTATSSGEGGTSSTYNFTNRFLCSGTTEVNSVLASGIPVRLYRRSNGVLIGSTTSTSGGLFEIESTYNESHYCVALYVSTVSGVDITETNALIYDHLIP